MGVMQLFEALGGHLRVSVKLLTRLMLLAGKLQVQPAERAVQPTQAARSPVLPRKDHIEPYHQGAALAANCRSFH